jgi:fructoselysine-6-P-deglycase FrlB-like protein
MRPDPEKPIDIFASNLISHNDPFENLSDDSTKIGASNSKNSDLTIVSPTDKYTNIDKDKVARQKTNNTLYRLQLASFKSEKESLKELARIKQQFVKTFDISNVRISRESYNNKFFYTIVSGGYTISQAKALCRKLNNMQQTCILY